MDAVRSFRRLFGTNRIFAMYWTWTALLLTAVGVVAFVRGDVVVGVIAIAFAVYSALVIAAGIRFGRGTFSHVLRLFRASR